MSDRAFALLACAVGALVGFWVGFTSAPWPWWGWALWGAGAYVAFLALRLWLEPPR